MQFCFRINEWTSNNDGIWKDGHRPVILYFSPIHSFLSGLSVSHQSLGHITASRRQPSAVPVFLIPSSNDCPHSHNITSKFQFPLLQQNILYPTNAIAHQCTFTFIIIVILRKRVLWAAAATGRKTRNEWARKDHDRWRVGLLNAKPEDSRWREKKKNPFKFFKVLKADDGHLFLLNVRP